MISMTIIRLCAVSNIESPIIQFTIHSSFSIRTFYVFPSKIQMHLRDGSRFLPPLTPLAHHMPCKQRQNVWKVFNCDRIMQMVCLSLFQNEIKSRERKKKQFSISKNLEDPKQTMDDKQQQRRIKSICWWVAIPIQISNFQSKNTSVMKTRDKVNKIKRNEQMFD